MVVAPCDIGLLCDAAFYSKCEVSALHAVDCFAMCFLHQNGHIGGSCAMQDVGSSEMQTAAVSSNTAAGMVGSQVCTLWT